MNDRQLDTLLETTARRAWPGPDRNDRVDRFLKEQSMPDTKPRVLTRPGIAIAAVALLCGSAVTAAVTHQVIARRGILTAEDGTRYEVEIVPMGEPATGTFVTDDGTVYNVRSAGDEKAVIAEDHPELPPEDLEPHMHVETDADEG